MAENREEVTQTVFVIRHGERIDHVDPHWAQGVERYYDPPITSVGEQQAREVGRMLKGKGKSIECVVSSPFLRCLQTAQPICDALDLPGVTVCNGVVDVFNHHFGIRDQPVVPAVDIADHGIRIVSSHNEPLPTYPERFKVGLNRYNREINRLADEYWPKNMVIVTHMCGVTQTEALARGEQYNLAPNADYCACVEVSRTTRDRHDWVLVTSNGVHLANVVVRAILKLFSFVIR